MPLRLPQLSFAILCDGVELETHGVQLEGPSSITAFVASEAGKQFRVMFLNNLMDYDLSIDLYMDGEVVNKTYLRARQAGRVLGIYKGSTAVLPFKFQELQLVDPDVENAPVIPEMGTIELRAFRSRAMRAVQYQPYARYGLHGGRVSERSKKAGWHHVSTADEVPINGPSCSVFAEYIDPPSAPCASFKVHYRPRDLLMAQGVIPGRRVDAGTGGASEFNDRKRAREGGSPGPSTRRPRRSIKNEDMSAHARAQRIRALQTELDSLMAGQPSSSVKRELKSPTPIVLGSAAGGIVDLTLED